MNVFFIFFFFFPVIQLKIVTIPINKYNGKIPYPELTFPKEKYRTTFNLNTYLSFSLIQISSNYLLSSSLKDSINIQLDDEYRSNSYLIDISLTNEITIPNISVYVTLDLGWTRDKGIALGYHYKNETYSIVHQLYNNKIIEHLQFSFHNIRSYLQGNFYIGGIPNNSHLSFPYKGIIKVREDLPTWGINLNGIKYKNKKYEMSVPCIVSSGMYGIISSDNFYDIMKEKVLKGRGCVELTSSTQKYSQYFLYCVEINKEEEIEMVLGNNVFKLRIEELFNNENHSLFYSNSKNQPILHFNGSIIGVEFLNKFNYSIFDYENHQIEFYSDYLKISLLKENIDLINIILFINIFLCFFNLFLMLFCKYKIIVKQ